MNSSSSAARSPSASYRSATSSPRSKPACAPGPTPTPPAPSAAASSTPTASSPPRSTPMPDPLRAYTGLLCIGDPHLASRAPGFRKDDYPRNILAKLEWAMNYAETNELLPVILGDLFHYPRDKDRK